MKAIPIKDARLTITTHKVPYPYSVMSWLSSEKVEEEDEDEEE